MNMRFKRFLTLQFALAFDRACSTLENDELVRVSRLMLHHLTVSHHAQKREDEAKALFVSLTYLRDCKDLMEGLGSAAAAARPLWSRVHDRLEKDCLDAAAGEDGQTRMLG
ncbi:MAG TPA: hypothetical protein VL588_02780 [Bdellovibrionota bacterium]|jgi:hypothetical protein|nr:hypothetical protein [Bdellovibrionota bacterium]